MDIGEGALWVYCMAVGVVGWAVLNVQGMCGWVSVLFQIGCGFGFGGIFWPPGSSSY